MFDYSNYQDPNIPFTAQNLIPSAEDVDTCLELAHKELIDQSRDLAQNILGRVTYAAKAALFGVAAVLQFSKVIIRFVALPLTKIVQKIAAATGTDTGNDISDFLKKYSGFEVVAIDTIITIHLIGKMIFSLTCIIQNPETVPNKKKLIPNQALSDGAEKKNFWGLEIEISKKKPNSLKTCLKKIKNFLDDTSLARGEKIQGNRKNPGGIKASMAKAASMTKAASMANEPEIAKQKNSFSYKLDFLIEFLFNSILASTSI